MDQRARWLDPHWLQKGVQALHDMLAVEPDLKRQMIQFLLDEGFWNAETLSWDGAVARFNTCANTKKDVKSEFFKVIELWALAKRFNRPQLVLAMVADLGYEARPIPSEERRLALLERIAEALEKAGIERDAATNELARLNSLTSTEPHMDRTVRAGIARFSLPQDRF